MKRPVLIFFLLSIHLGANAQNQDSSNNSLNKNELRFNALYLILGGVEVSYEALLSEESGLGISVFLPIDNSIDLNYYVSPFYRLYFGKKSAAGFFVEGFGMLNSAEDYVYDFTEDADGFTFSNGDYENVTDFALGIGIGGKFLTNRGFVAEIGLGVGRNLFVNERDTEIVVKGGIIIGYRF